MEEKEKSFVHADYNFLRKIVWFHMVLRRTKGTDRWMGIALGGVYVYFSLILISPRIYLKLYIYKTQY